jgi:hypothetical protein
VSGPAKTGGTDAPGETWEPPGAKLPSFGPGWDAAIAYGIDVTLLLENLERTPLERLQRLQEVVDFHEMLRNAAHGRKPVR